MEYLPTFALECGHFSPNVGKYSLHGASGIGKDTESHGFRVFAKKKPEKVRAKPSKQKTVHALILLLFVPQKCGFLKNMNAETQRPAPIWPNGS